MAKYLEAAALFREATRISASDTSNGDLTCQELDLPENANVIVCGDLHGEYGDFVTKFEQNDANYPISSTHYVWTGDIIDGRNPNDRDEFNLLKMIAQLKINRPDRIHILLGNHEFMALCGNDKRDWSYINTAMWTDESNVDDRAKAEYISALLEWFMTFPIALVVTKNKQRVIMVHGGPGFSTQVSVNGTMKFDLAPPAVYDLKNLNKLPKRKLFETIARTTVGPRKIAIQISRSNDSNEAVDLKIPGTEYSFRQAITDLLWSDVANEGGVFPSVSVQKRVSELRKQYGPLGTRMFLDANKAAFLIRGHQPRKTDYLDETDNHIISLNFRVHESHENRVITIHHSSRRDLIALYTCLLVWSAENPTELAIIRDDTMAPMVAVEFDTWKKREIDFKIGNFRPVRGNLKLPKLSKDCPAETPNGQIINKEVISMCEPGDIVLFSSNRATDKLNLGGIVSTLEGGVSHIGIIVIDEEMESDGGGEGGNIIILESNRYSETSRVLKYDYFARKDKKRPGKMLPKASWGPPKDGVRSCQLTNMLKFYHGDMYLVKLPEEPVREAGGRRKVNMLLIEQFKKMYSMGFDENLSTFINVIMRVKSERPVLRENVFCSEFIAKILMNINFGLSGGKTAEFYRPGTFNVVKHLNSPNRILKQNPLKIWYGEYKKGKEFVLGFPIPMFKHSVTE